jgi:exoribonuclease II
MWLFKKQMAVPVAALEVYRTVAPLPLRLRDRAKQFRLHSHDDFELESIGLIHALAVVAIENSRLKDVSRDRLQDAFSLIYADRTLRLRLTHNLFEMHSPLDAARANQVMRSLELTAHDRLDLLNMEQFLVSRLSAYKQGNLEDMIKTFLAYLETSPQFELMFSLAVFITDTSQAVREHVDDLNARVYLV